MYQTRPDDYDAFRCIAGACPQTCCAAWEIVVDPDAQDAYLRLRHPLAQKLRRVMRVDADGDTYFAQSDGRCPFLCADGLCELQRTLGAQSLCRTCRDFPRWEVLLCDRVEQGLSLALCLTEDFLAGTGAVSRVHGGGFAGTIQAFVPIDKTAEYAAKMDAVFGEHACHILSVRPSGACRIL